VSWRAWLTEPLVRDLDPDSTDFTTAHREVLRKKPMLRRLFEGFYRDCRAMDERHFAVATGLRLEIGSGSSFLKELYPDVWTSDLKPLPFVDFVAQGEHLPVAPGSVRAIYAMNVFHHLPKPRDFFRDLCRVLTPGGGVVMIEPAYSPVARFLFKRLHASEGYDPNIASWDIAGNSGAMSNANQALSYVVLRRDRRQFESEFPDLEVVVDRPHTPLLYLVSGGVNFRQLLPSFCTGLVVGLEWLLQPLNPLFGIQHTVVLRKRRAP
jgi:SAM-dependent methyltransferase